MYFSGRERAPALHAMRIPSSARPPLKRVLPWRGVLGACILISLCMNIILLALNRYQALLLQQLDFAELAVTEGGVGSVELVSEPFVSSATALDELTTSLDLRVTLTSRRLSSSGTGGGNTDCNSSSAGSGAGGHHGPYPHDAMLYLFNALVMGAAVMQLSARFPTLQQSILLFVIGFIASLVLKGLHLSDKIAVWGESYEMWMNIDPHLLLFSLLPALLAGDAMTIDTSVARRVYKQCLYLAGPGVLMGGFLTAFFLNAYIDWNSEHKFLLSLCAGSILCATDPVAVVALLKQLGASPMLTVQIQGESLLNDGTAIVLYLISYNMLSGKDYDALDIATFLMEKALMAFAIGLFIGYFFFGWIRAVSNKLSHSSSMVQITLTLCCAYWSFIFVEGVLSLSGVLATVASSLVLADNMWPYVVSADSMSIVWHTFESLGNTIVFFLAGSLTGFIVVDIDPVDWIHLCVIYMVLLIIRTCLLFGSRPILQFLHNDKMPVTWQDATLMTWGGLRGAVGLALAIQVNNGRAPDANGVPQIDKKDAERLLFFVCGIAFLTTLVNATSAPFLVQKLGITALPAARQTLLRMFHQQLVHWSMDSANPPEVTNSLKMMLHEAAEEIEHQQTSKTGPTAVRASCAVFDDFAEEIERQPSKASRNKSVMSVAVESCSTTSHAPERVSIHSVDSVEVSSCAVTSQAAERSSTLSVDSSVSCIVVGPSPRPSECSSNRSKAMSTVDSDKKDLGSPAESRQTSASSPRSPKRMMSQHSIRSGKFVQSQDGVQDNEVLVRELKKMEERYGQTEFTDFQLLEGDLPENLLGKVDNMCNLVEDEWVDVGMAKVVNQCFLTLVYNNYWKLITRGKLRPGSPESDVLLTSVRVSMSPYRADLTDYDYVHKSMLSQEDLKNSHSSNLGALSEGVSGKMTGCVAKMVGTWYFNLFIAVTILLNSVVVCIEELFRTQDNDSNAFWLVADGIFTCIFVVEFVLKLSWLRYTYWLDSWNRFDSFLVFVGMLGLVMNILTQGGGAELAGQTRVMRLTRVLRTMRFLRVFRLFHAKLSRDKHVSLELAKHLQKITTMSCFITAHIMAQNDLVKYFGGNGMIDQADETELARCILQSQVSTYNALFAAANTQKQIGQHILTELQTLYQRKNITEGLSAFVEKANKDGAISAMEAHSILHPLNHQIATCMKKLNDRAEGVLDITPTQTTKRSVTAFVAGGMESGRASGTDSDKVCDMASCKASGMADGVPAACIGQSIAKDANPLATDMKPGVEEAPLAPAVPEMAQPGVTLPGVLAAEP